MSLTDSGKHPRLGGSAPDSACQSPRASSRPTAVASGSRVRRLAVRRSHSRFPRQPQTRVDLPRAQRVVPCRKFPSRLGAPAMSSLTRGTDDNPHRGWRAADSAPPTGNPAHASSSVIAPPTTTQRPVPRVPESVQGTDFVLYVEDNDRPARTRRGTGPRLCLTIDAWGWPATRS